MHAVDHMVLARTGVSNLLKILEYEGHRQLCGKKAVEGFCTTLESSWSLSHHVQDGKSDGGSDYVSCGINLPVPVNPMAPVALNAARHPAFLARSLSRR